MRALTILPLCLTAGLLAACQVTNDAANNQSTVTVSGDAAKEGVASAVDATSNGIDKAANKINEVSNDSSEVRSGIGNLTASAKKLGQSVDHAADSLGDAADHAGDRVGDAAQNTHVEVQTSKTTRTEKK
jgi:methyl-accepting chemotaxis protein